MRCLTLGLPLVLASACVEVVSEDLEGQLVQVDVSVLGESCVPARFVGDGGLQFHGIRADGGQVLSLSQTVQYGPLPDGGLLGGTVLLPVPRAPVAATVGLEPACDALVGGLSWADGGIRLDQSFPGVDGCPSGPLWLPAGDCASARLLRLSPVRACQLRCVHLGASGDVSCEC